MNCVDLKTNIWGFDKMKKFFLENSAFALLFVALLGYVNGAQALTTFTINGPSGGDDRPFIQDAINSAIAVGNAEVVLRGGTYQLQSYDAEAGTHLLFFGGNNVSLKGYPGETVNFIYWNIAARGILANTTTDLQIDSLSFDWKYHPFGQGTVVSVDTANKVVWATNDEGYATWDNSIFNLPFQTTYLLRSTRGNTPPNCTIIPKVASPTGSWGFMTGYDWFMYSDLDNCPDGIQPGQKVVLNRNSFASVGIHLLKVSGAMLSNLTFYASPGLVTFDEFSDRGIIYSGINFVNYNIIYHPTDSSRTITANADGIHSRASRAPLYVFNSMFYGLADNAIDAHGQAAYYVDLAFSGGDWTLAYYDHDHYLDGFRNGDAVEIYNVSANATRCSLITKGTPYTCGSNSCVKVSTPSCSGMVPYVEGEGNESTADWITNINQAATMTIDNNKFYGSRGLAIINRRWDATITNNVIGDPYYGKPNWAGIHEGVCPYDLQYGPQGRYVYPGLDSQVIYNNTGIYGNLVSGCWP
jgi:hypothetical protein